MTINLKVPDIRELKPRITVFGVGGAGGNAVNNMITAGLVGCDFVVANTDAQALTLSKAERIIQMGVQVTEGLGAGSQPDVGRAAAEEVIDELRDHLAGAHMVFVTAGMGGGTGTGAAPVIAQAAKELGILTVGVVTKPFHFEGVRRMKVAEAGIIELQKQVDTLLVIPNQNLFRVANEKTTFADAFAMADQVLYSGVACITDLMVKEGLINLDFADVRAVMREMGKAMMGTGEASGDKRALSAAEAAISNPLIDETSMKGAKGLLISITGGKDLTLYEVDEAATRIREEVDQDANIIVGATFDESLDGIVRVSVVATGIDVALSAHHPASTRQTITPVVAAPTPAPQAIAAASRLAELTQTLRATAHRMTERTERTDQAHRAVAQALSVAPAAETAEQSAQAEAPPAPSITAIEDVTIRPMSPKPTLFMEPAEEIAEAAPQPIADKPFIPPQAERPAVRAPRMPRIDELPIPAQNQIRARQSEAPPEKPRVSLLQRLASVGLGRREEEAPAQPRQVAAERAAPPMPKAPPMPPMRPQEPRSAESVSEYAKRSVPQRGTPQGLDQHGRQAPVNNSFEDDQLEIPAFLRRQAN
jgi:cell division protein FtsZ